MLILYNILQTLVVILLFPLLCIYIAFKSKYRKHIPKRLGFGLRESLNGVKPSSKTIWIHALSVGEVTSAVPLVKKISQEFDDITLIFSASTQTGYTLGQKLLLQYCDRIIPFPLDIFIVVEYFIRLIKPDLFILVETDFWPNILTRLHKKRIPIVLVNGRISRGSMNHYQRLSWFFQPMFQTISHICVQSDVDKNRLLELGITADQISNLGNLKFASALSHDDSTVHKLLESTVDPVFIAGSTHTGEEEIILNAYITLKAKFPLKLIIAPRDINRAQEIKRSALSRQLTVQLRSSGEAFDSDLYILDTIGELVAVYEKCDVCFVGGSLVDEGGHNPLEPASSGKPVLFGPFVSDFKEICEDLVESSGGFIVTDQTELIMILTRFLENASFLKSSGDAAKNWVSQKKTILHDHIHLLRQYL